MFNFFGELQIIFVTLECFEAVDWMTEKYQAVEMV